GQLCGSVRLGKSMGALDNKVPGGIQSDMLIGGGGLIVRAPSWFLRSRRLAEPMEGTIERFRRGADALYDHLLELLDAQARSQLDVHAVRWTQAGVPQEIALEVASLDTMFAALDIIEIAEAAKRPVEVVAGVYFQLS